MDIGGRLVVGYARESTQLESQDLALDWQVERLNSYGCNQVIIDRASGASNKRVGYRELLVLIQKDLVAEVVICNLTRLSRSRTQLDEFIETISKHSVSLVSLDGSIDLSTVMGRGLVAFQGVMAQMEREIIQERIKEGYAGVRARKLPIHAPFGYQIKKNNTPPFKQLEIDETQAEIAKWIRRSVVESGLAKTAREINERFSDLEGIPKSPAGIRCWLQCETLYGHLQYFRHKKGKRLIYWNNHKALFSAEERDEVEKAIQFRSKCHGFRSDPIRFPLSGLVICEFCNRNMQVSYNKNRPNSKVQYRCIHATRKACSNKHYILASDIEQSLIQTLTQKAEEIATESIRQKSKTLVDPRIVELRQQLAVLESMPSNQHLEIAIAGIKNELIEIEINSLNQSTAKPIDKARLDKLKAFADPDFWLNIQPEHKHQIYQLLVKRVICGKSVSLVELLI